MLVRWHCSNLKKIILFIPSISLTLTLLTAAPSKNWSWSPWNVLLSCYPSISQVMFLIACRALGFECSIETAIKLEKRGGQHFKSPLLWLYCSIGKTPISSRLRYGRINEWNDEWPRKSTINYALKLMAQGKSQLDATTQHEPVQCFHNNY